jgi:hypothetical protein
VAAVGCTEAVAVGCTVAAGRTAVADATS